MSPFTRKRARSDAIQFHRDATSNYDNRKGRRVKRNVAELWREFATISPLSILYTLNLHGYSTAHIPEDEPTVVQLAGWPEGVLEFISMYEISTNTLNSIR